MQTAFSLPYPSGLVRSPFPSFFRGGIPTSSPTTWEVLFTVDLLHLPLRIPLLNIPQSPAKRDVGKRQREFAVGFFLAFYCLKSIKNTPCSPTSCPTPGLHNIIFCFFFFYKSSLLRCFFSYSFPFLFFRSLYIQKYPNIHLLVNYLPKTKIIEGIYIIA